ncbi:hypothetical protein [Agromyces sp. GXQ0307]|uniref:hypothetical protein n=1 Tax=Agromyces sp. GXQ0307 TaxID=3377835 RepID=UPI00383AF2A8
MTTSGPGVAMSEFMTRSDAPLEPIRGVAAFESESPSAVASRSGQLLGMSLFAFGDDQQAADLQADAAELQVPQVHRADPALAEFADDAMLEHLVHDLLAEHWPEFPGHLDLPESERLSGAAALWSAVDRSHDPRVLTALLALSARSADDLEAVSGAAGLDRLAEGRLESAQVLLDRLADSPDAIAGAIARVMLNRPSTALEPPVGGGSAESGGPSTVSVAVHGTWGMVGEDPWYRPGADLHTHIRREVSANLYDDRGYYIWTGGFSQRDRDDGARDLSLWRELNGYAEFDEIYAHSHGGNVALSAAAGGERIRMLVLMHTPALRRPDDEWERIARNIRRVMVMRTRMDLVVLADGLRNGSRQRFDPQQLPHFELALHWAKGDGWFSHGLFVSEPKWQRYHIAELVESQRRIAEYGPPR